MNEKDVERVPPDSETHTSSGGSAEQAETLIVDPGKAWKALGVIIDWVKHAEAKAGVTLAVVGVVSAVCITLLRTGRIHLFS